MHRLRVLSALLLIPPFLLLVQFGSPDHFSLLVAFAILLCAWEFAWLCPVGADLWVATLTVAGSLLWQAAMLGLLPATVVPPLVVGVALDTVAQLESYQVMRRYDGFLEKGRIRSGRMNKAGEPTV